MKKQLIKSCFVGAAILLILPFLPLSLAATTVPPRQNVVWATGYWQGASSLNPWNSNPAYGIATMYETLFGYNAVDGKYIPVIGTSFYWNPANDTECIVNLNPAAKFSDDSFVTAEDVVYSYKLAMYNSSNFGPNMCSRLEHIAPFLNEFDVEKGVVKVNSTAVKFITQSAFDHTGFLDVWLSSNVPIVKKSVWSAIFASQAAAGKYMDDFANDWFSSTFNSTWKVTSGPYLPYYTSPTRDIEIYELRSDWWGAGKIHTDLPNGGIPQAKYIGLNHYPSNTLQDFGFLQGDIDYYSGYFDKIWTVMPTHPEISTWFGDQQPYMVGVSSMLECVPNWLKYPFNELWFRQTLAYAIDYDESSKTAASSYLQRAKQGFVDNLSAPLAPIYNDTIQQTYGIDTDLNAALALLFEHCYLSDGTNLTGAAAGTWSWYTKDTPSAYLGMPLAGFGAGQVVADALPGVLGTNVKIPFDDDVDGSPQMSPDEGYDCITVTGWTDVDIATQMWCSAFYSLNISTVYREVGYDPWVAAFEKSTFELGMMCSSPKLMNNPVVFLNGYRGPHIWNRNTTSWSGAAANAYEAAFEAFEVATPGSAEYKKQASIMQEMLASEIPSIPLYGNGFWYAFSNKYWTGWVSAANDFNQITTCWDNDNFALRTRQILNLRSTGAVPIPWDWIFGIVAIGAIAALVIGIVVMRKRRGA